MFNYDHTPVARTALSGTGLRDLAHLLLHPERSMPVPYVRLAELVANGLDHQVPPEAIDEARRRLQDAGARGNRLAAELLNELDREVI